jgi:preprotein translocase subunit SecD
MNSTARKVLLVVLLLVVCAGAGWYAWHVWRRPPTIEEVGGTRLYYEIDMGRAPKGDFDPKDLAKAWQRLLDQDYGAGIVVRPVGVHVIRIDVPRQDDHAALVEVVKIRVYQMGELEFRILANQNDDKEGIEAAAGQIMRARDDAAMRKELERRAEEDEPPPDPRPGDPAGFASPLGRFHYSWVEVWPEALASLRLLEPSTEAGESDPELRARVANAREKGGTVPLPNLGSALLYTRPCANRGLSEEKRKSKGVDYFLLTREPEGDRAIMGAYLVSANASEIQGQPSVDIRFNKKGGELLHELTVQNQPPKDSPFRRHLAIILDSEIRTATALNAVMGERAQITGNFTPDQVKDIVTILRSGAILAPLKPVPIQEETVEPKAGG